MRRMAPVGIRGRSLRCGLCRCKPKHLKLWFARKDTALRLAASEDSHELQWRQGDLADKDLRVRVFLSVVGYQGRRRKTTSLKSVL